MEQIIKGRVFSFDKTEEMERKKECLYEGSELLCLFSKQIEDQVLLGNLSWPLKGMTRSKKVSSYKAAQKRKKKYRGFHIQFCKQRMTGIQQSYSTASPYN